MGEDQPGGTLVLGLDNVALDLQVAGLGNRVLAAFIDRFTMAVQKVIAEEGGRPGTGHRNAVLW